jgi:hypothetical protein
MANPASGGPDVAVGIFNQPVIVGGNPPGFSGRIQQKIFNAKAQRREELPSRIASTTGH